MSSLYWKKVLLGESDEFCFEAATLKGFNFFYSANIYTVNLFFKDGSSIPFDFQDKGFYLKAKEDLESTFLGKE